MIANLTTKTTAAEITCLIIDREDGPLFDLSWQESLAGLSGLLVNDVQPDQASSEAKDDQEDELSAEGGNFSRRWLDGKTIIYGRAWQPHLSSDEAKKTAIADFLKAVESVKAKTAEIILDGPAGSRIEIVTSLARALGIASWRFETYRSKKKSILADLRCSILVQAEKEAELAAPLAAALDLAQSVNLAREMVNEPGSLMTPIALAERAARVAEENALECEILDRDALVAGGYSGILAVSQGSQHEPRMLVLRYRPEGAPPQRHLALVGKGVSFDTGGISLKPGKGMHEMKSDMAGAAAVIAAMRSIARLRPGVAVTGIAVCAENMIGSRAQRPGDIIRHKNGKFIQVDNTDAEGRLCLIDGLARAGEEGAETIVDIATLTGACIRALGTSLAGVIGNDEALVGSLVAIGEKSGECLWPFPLLKEYKKELETPHADLRNIGNGNAGQITAALFMQPFVPKKAKWAHLDIAGPAYFEKGWKYYSPGATGFGTQLFVDWVQSISQSQ